MAIDDVSDLSRRVQYTAGAGQTAFTYPFRIFDEGDLDVYVDDVQYTLGTMYSVTGVDNDLGGSVIFTTGLSAGDIVTIYSDTAIDRDTDYQQNGPWTSARLNSELDKFMVISQELRAKISRAIRGSILGNTVAEMPSAADRASKYLWFNASGDPTVVTGDAAQPLTHSVYLVYPTNGQTVITVPAAYTQGAYDLSVYLNGVKQVVGVDYAETSITSITLTSPATTGDIIEFSIGEVFDVTLVRTGREEQSFTGLTSPTITLTTASYTPGAHEVDVFFNGALLATADYTETNSTTITLGFTPVASDQFRVIVGRAVNVTNVSRSQVGAVLYPQSDAEIAAGVTPTDYGYAPGDLRRYGTNTIPGTTDMTTAIAAWCSVGGAHRLTAPPVAHYVSGQAALVSGTDMSVHGATFIQHAGGLSIFKGSGVSNVTIRGGTYQGVGASTVFTDSDAGLIYFNNSGAVRCSNVKVYDTRVTAAYTGISAIKVDGLWVEDNEVDDFFVYGILASKSTDFHIDRNNVHDCARSSRTGSAPYNAYGIMATGDDVGGSAQAQGSISHNHIRNVKLWDGIMTHDCTKLSIVCNTIDDVRTGIDIGHQAATNVISIVEISDNTINLTQTDAHAGNAALHGGVICIGYDASTRIEGLIVSGNQINGFGAITGMTMSGDGSPITIENCDDFAVTGNVVSGVGTAISSTGMYLVGTLNRGAVTGNTLSGAMPSGGIRLAGVTADVLGVTGNTISQSTASDAAVYVTGTTCPRFVSANNATNSTIPFDSATSTLGSYAPVQSVASAAAVTLPYGYSTFNITGSTNITSIVATGHTGDTARLIFAAALTLTDGSNLKLAGNFVTTADDVITLTCDGTNWYEVSRSAN